MTSAELENLVGIGQLKREAPATGEVEALQHSGDARLADARRRELSPESRFDLAYNAAHSLALAALRRLGYRPANRFVVFQCLPHTVGVASSVWRVLAKAHDNRNLAEYEGVTDVDERLVAAMIDAATEVSKRLRAAGDLPATSS